ncbi:hypothetical protein CCZ01_09280 [Helicobacter monodelphidis]|uniref:hypothetical protein n=1 Tax=Helicobacter sp. 15-1451 TaxID=2004995 RepID=UPI000DCC5BCB|nr:hypothetical protein [Helicobacter sp. 15-1451]RAX56505.1 hypothetical protein CCZ01_09280 [Helicobacter sp. 15-1451]
MRIFLIISILILPLIAEDSKHRLDLMMGLDSAYYHYEEPSIMKQYGLAVGMNVGTDYIYNQSFKVGAEGRFLYAIGAYEGGTLNTGSTTYQDEKVISGMASSIIQTEFKTGINLLNLLGFRDSSLFLQGGFGYWYLNDPLTFAARVQQYQYIPLELKGNISINSQTSFDYLLGYHHFLSGKNKGGMSQVNWSNDIFLKQEKGFGLKALVGTSHKKSERYSVFYHLTLDYWKIDDSDSAPSVSEFGILKSYYEPKNYTFAIGFRTGIKF